LKNIGIAIAGAAASTKTGKMESEASRKSFPMPPVGPQLSGDQEA